METKEQNIVELNVKTTEDRFTIYGCGKFHETSKVLDRAEASLLYIELHKWLFTKEKQKI